MKHAETVKESLVSYCIYALHNEGCKLCGRLNLVCHAGIPGLLSGNVQKFLHGAKYPETRPAFICGAQ